MAADPEHLKARLTPREHHNKPGPKSYMSKYSPEVHEEIVKFIREGASKSMAFKLAGLNEQTPFDWLAQGRKDPEKYPEYVQLAADIDFATAEVQQEMVASIKATATSGRPHTWQAAAWYLERTAPADFGKNDRVEVKLPDGPLVQLNQVILNDSEARSIGRDLLRRVTAPIALEEGDEDVIDA